MYRVLIVDDEKIERKGIRRLIEKSGEPCSIMEAANGKEAAELLDGEEIDILVTDIRMPRMTGLELAKEVSERHGDMQTILFSGAQDFGSAKAAIRCGVQDYILKPVDPAEFDLVYRRACERVRIRNEKRRRTRSVSRTLNQYFMTRFILGGKEAESDDVKSCIELEEWDKIRYMMLIECPNRFFEEAEEEFQRGLEEQFGQEITYLNLNTEQALLLYAGELESPLRTAKQTEAWIREKFFKEVSIAVSARCGSFRELPAAYQRLDELMEEKFYQTGRHIFCERQEDADGDIIEEGSLMGMLEQDIRNRDVYHLRDHFDRVVEKYRDLTRFPSLYVKFVFSGIIKTLHESGGMMESGGIDRLVDRIYGCTSIGEVIGITREKMERYMQYISEDKGSLRFKAEATKEYIRNHYGEEISLEILAGRLYLSPGYLSMIFKKETGENLNQFIKNVRLEESARMLADPELTVSEVGRRAGFKNMSYYSKCFRREYGVTPDAYRKNILKK